MIKLLIADDHAMVRKGLQVFLGTQPDIWLVGEAADGEETISQVIRHSPDIILMDLNMPILSGIETTKRLMLSHPHVKVIVLTSFSDQEHVLPAIRAGAKGYLLKDIEPEKLADAIRRVYEGRVELHPDVTLQLMNLVTSSEDPSVQNGKVASSPKNPTPFQLTRREHEVLRLIAVGMSNKDIGEALSITEKTVKTHVSHLLDKLGLSDRTQAAIYAVKHGMG